jgi:cell division septum initiation protein DivIVA
MLTNDQLKIIRERAEKATPGPWEYRENTLESRVRDDGQIIKYCHPEILSSAYQPQLSYPSYRVASASVAAWLEGDDISKHHIDWSPKLNMEFIAATRTDVPILLDEIDRCWEEIKELKMEVAAAECLDAEAKLGAQSLYEENRRLQNEIDRLKARSGEAEIIIDGLVFALVNADSDDPHGYEYEEERRALEFLAGRGELTGKWKPREPEETPAERRERDPLWREYNRRGAVIDKMVEILDSGAQCPPNAVRCLGCPATCGECLRQYAEQEVKGDSAK